MGTNKVIISHDSSSLSSGVKGSTSNSTKIDTITIDGQGHIIGVATGPHATAGEGLFSSTPAGNYIFNVQYNTANNYIAKCQNTTVAANINDADKMIIDVGGV